MVRTVEQSRATAEAANIYARQFMLEADTHPKFGTLTPERRLEISIGIRNMRAEVNISTQTSLGADRIINRFITTVEGSKISRLGNCGESASLALDYVVNLEQDKEASAEIYQMDPAIDHVFCIIDRAKGSDPMKPETWGPNAFVCDPWSNEVYPASELSKPKVFTFAKPSSYNFTSDGSLTANTPLVNVTFDPLKHTIEPQKNLNTDYIRNTKSMEHIDSVVDAYRQKSAIVLSALQTFSNDLDQLAKRLEKDKATISQEKAAVIKNKIAAVKAETDRLREEIASNIPDRDDYLSVRNNFEQRLKQSVKNAGELLQLGQDERNTLDKKKNPLLDTLMGKLSTNSSTEINQAAIKAKISLEKMVDVALQPLTAEKLSQAKKIRQEFKDRMHQVAPPKTEDKTQESNHSITPFS